MVITLSKFQEFMVSQLFMTDQAVHMDLGKFALTELKALNEYLISVQIK